MDTHRQVWVQGRILGRNTGQPGLGRTLCLGWGNNCLDKELLGALCFLNTTKFDLKMPAVTVSRRACEG